MIIDSISARRAARICGFETVAMLDYLQRSGVFVPENQRRLGRGKGRRYNFRELMVLKTISVLLKNGASVAALKKSLIDFQARKWSADRGSLQYDEDVFKYFIVSGDDVVFAKSDLKLYDLTKNGQMLFSFIIDIDKIHSEIAYSLQQHDLPLKEANS